MTSPPSAAPGAQLAAHLDRARPMPETAIQLDADRCRRLSLPVMTGRERRVRVTVLTPGANGFIGSWFFRCWRNGVLPCAIRTGRPMANTASRHDLELLSSDVRDCAIRAAPSGVSRGCSIARRSIAGLTCPNIRVARAMCKSSGIAPPRHRRTRPSLFELDWPMFEIRKARRFLGYDPRSGPRSAPRRWSGRTKGRRAMSRVLAWHARTARACLRS